MFGSLSLLYVVQQTHFCQYGVQFAVEIEDLSTEISEISPLEERDLLRDWNTIMEA